MTWMDEQLISLSSLDKLPESTLGHDVLRYVTLPHVLGDEKDVILYFIGRNLSRKLHIEVLDDIIYVFRKFKWGQLELIKEKKKQLLFHLMSDEIVSRLQSPFETDFRLEAGFIAESITKITERPAECIETVNERLYRIEFKVVFTD